MPNGTPANPFTPQGSLSTERLLRYLRGELPPAEEHEVELHLENDPLLREAAEGLALPGAMEGLSRLGTHRPRGGRSATAWVLGGAAVLTVGAALWWMMGVGTDHTVLDGHRMVEAVPGREEESRSVENRPPGEKVLMAELQQAVAPPESLRSAYRGGDNFISPADGEERSQTEAATTREDPPAPVHVIPPGPVTPDPVVEGTPKRGARSAGSRRLMFMHDLKLVHPQELYPVDPVLKLAAGSVEARYGDAQARAEGRPEERNVPYERFFRTAMGRYARGDRQGCLADLFTVLEQYPDDVNALFYAGLCCHDLGLYSRAERLLDRARTHEVDTFAEEAAWYHALSVEGARGRAAALPLLNAVAEGGGFYAERARRHLGR